MPASISAYSVSVQDDGKLLVAGYSFNGTDNDFAVVRYNTDGTLDTSFSGDGKLTTAFGAGNDTAQSVTVQADGKIPRRRQQLQRQPMTTSPLARYNSDGTLDTSFAAATASLTTAVSAGTDKATASRCRPTARSWWQATSFNGSNYDFALVRYNADGTLDTTFAPVTTLDGNPTFVEDGAAVVLDADVDVSDAELDALNGGLGNYAGASLTLVRNGGASADDAFAFNDGNGITLSGGNLIKNAQIIASFDTTTTPGELVVSFSDAGGEIPTSADVDNILRQITYANSNDTPPASVQIDWTFDDGNTGAQGAGGALTATGSTTVTITAVNDAPVNTVPGAQSTEQDTPLVFSASNGNAISVTDPDASTRRGHADRHQRHGQRQSGRVGGPETLVNSTTADVAGNAGHRGGCRRQLRGGLGQPESGRRIRGASTPQRYDANGNGGGRRDPGQHLDHRRTAESGDRDRRFRQLRRRLADQTPGYAASSISTRSDSMPAATSWAPSSGWMPSPAAT